jgi:hypothetical protein
MKARSLLFAVLLFGTSAVVTHAAVGPAEPPQPREKRWSADAFTFEIAEGGSVDRERLANALSRSAATWNEVGSGPTINVELPNEVESASSSPDGRNTVSMFLGEEWPYPEDAGAVTTIYSDDQGDALEIIEADIMLNPSFDWRYHDLENVLTHEIGHALGLPDLDRPGEATMYYLVLPGETRKRDLAHEDRRLLVLLYDGVEIGEEEPEGCPDGFQIAALLGLFSLRRRFRRAR